MNKETRIQKISDIYQRSGIGKQELMWEDELEGMEVHKIPLKYLIYNKYNGRILSRTKSLEAQGREIDPETDEGKAVIEKLLWESKEDRNKKTKSDLESYGQKKVGIITKDGIIIDGNRRAMLLNKIPEYDYFKAIILPVTLDENPIEIEKLETSYQMGEDEKLGYNPIEKYLKVKNLTKQGVSIQQISDWMGESKATVDEYWEVMNVMDEYLEYLNYKGIYTQLDGKEDQFINLTKWLRNFYGEGSIKGFDGYKDSDVDDLKNISFDYIRVKYEGKKFRCIGYGLKQNHFFGNKEIWESFKNQHFENIEPIYDQEGDINLDSENLTLSLNDRDTKFKESAQLLLDENLDSHYTKLRNIQSQDEPVKLVTRAFDNISAINRRSKNFEQPEVLIQVEKLNQITTEMMQEKSKNMALKQVFNLLEAINFDEPIGDKDVLLDEVKKINKLSFDIKKILGG